MSLDAKLVVQGYAHLMGRALDDDEAEKIAKHLWSSEEFVASLVLNDKVFASEPSIIDALMAAAQANHVETRTPRTDKTDFTRAMAARRQTRAALAALLEADKSNKEHAGTAHDALKALAMSAPVGKAHPGIQWRIEREGS